LNISGLVGRVFITSCILLMLTSCGPTGLAIKATELVIQGVGQVLTNQKSRGNSGCGPWGHCPGLKRVNPNTSKMIDDLSNKSNQKNTITCHIERSDIYMDLSRKECKERNSVSTLSLAELMERQSKSSSKKVTPPVIFKKSTTPSQTNTQLVKSNADRLWRTNECYECFLVGADLSNMNLRNAHLEGANLSGANLSSYSPKWCFGF
jgi:hypothetical protein